MAQLEASVAQLRTLIRRGRELGGALAIDPASEIAQAGVRVWQRDCAAAVSQLSGGSKAHWLSRAYSDALLVRSSTGGALVEAPATDIVGRVLGVLDQAVASLSQPGAAAAAPPQVHRFDFVRSESLRPILEEAYADSARAIEEGDFTRSLMTSCGILEAIITDAIDARLKPSRSTGMEPSPQGKSRSSELSFGERIVAAEQANLIGGGCARLPAVARAYRDANGPGGVVTERDAKITRQVLHVMMRDLDPGR
jgi:hypothetical protein